MTAPSGMSEMEVMPDDVNAVIENGVELLSNLVYEHQAASLPD